MNDSLLIDAFLEMLSAERGASQNTLAAYARDLDDFSQFLQAKRTDCLRADAEMVRQWLASLNRNGCAAYPGTKTVSDSANVSFFVR